MPILAAPEFTFYHSVSRHIADVHVVRFYDLRVTKRDLAHFLTLFFVFIDGLFLQNCQKKPFKCEVCSGNFKLGRLVESYE